MNYAQANEQLTGRCHNKRKLHHHTYLVRREDERNIVIRLHNTDIITFKSNGDTVLNTGGWRTVTTKERFRRFGFQVNQHNHIWYINNHLFRDGCIVKPDGSIVGATNITASKKITQFDKKLMQYADDYIDALFSGEVPRPSAGDCWYCAMKDKDGKTMGETSKSDHIEKHIAEKYYVPSIVANAIEKFPISQIARSVLELMWDYHNNACDNEEREIATDQIRSSLRRYLRRQIGMAS